MRCQLGAKCISVESADDENGNVLFFQLQLEDKFQLKLKEENITIFTVKQNLQSIPRL